MDRLKVLLPFIILLASCVPQNRTQIPAREALTPFLTSTAAEIPTEVATEEPQSTATTAPTATPLVHVVALGETVSSIALRYGLDMGVVLSANPDINPNALTVGTEIIIPAGETGAQIGQITEPLALKVGNPKCRETSENGLWCFVPVENPLKEAADLVSVSISLIDPSGGNKSEMNVPILLYRIEPGQMIPAVAYFPPPVQRNHSASASLTAALPAANSGITFLPAEIVNEQINLRGDTADVSGEVEVSGENGVQTLIRVAALGFDASGALVGARVMEIDTTLTAGDEVDFSFRFFSTSGMIASVNLLAEAIRADQ